MKPSFCKQILFLLVLMLSTGTAGADKLVNMSSRYCLDTDGRVVNGGAVRVWGCQQHPNQTWTIVRMDARYFRLVNESSGFCLDTDGVPVNGGNVRVWSCVDHSNQLWEIFRFSGSRYRLKNKASGFCLDTNGEAVNGGLVRTWECVDHPNQFWFVESGDVAPDSPREMPEAWEDPAARQLIDEWLRQVERCTKREFAPASYIDRWGRICGTVPTGIINCSQTPDHPPGWDSYRYLWNHNWCHNYYTYRLQDYVRRRQSGATADSLASCKISVSISCAPN